MRRGFGPPASRIWVSISSAIVRTSRVLLALTITNASVIASTSPTASTTGSVAFFEAAACAASAGQFGSATAARLRRDRQVASVREVFSDDDRHILRIGWGRALRDLTH